MKLIKKQDAGIQPVYDIGVPKHHNFMLSNGLIASNCFNKSHSISYSFITYASAYLKANHPLEFFCGLMSVRSQGMQPKDWAEKAPQYLYEARQMGVKIQGPTINESEIGFSIRDDTLYFGFNGIRDVGKTAAASIIRARKAGKFKDVLNFLARVDKTKVTRRTFQALVKAGAFDKEGYKRDDLINRTDELFDYFSKKQLYSEQLIKLAEYELESNHIEELIIERDNLRQLKRASEYKRNPGPPLTKDEEARLQELEDMKIRRKVRPADIPDPSESPPQIDRHPRVPISVDQLLEQAEYIGCFVGAHPARILFPNTQSIAACVEGEWALVSGMVNSYKQILTKKGDKMAFISIGDGTAVADVTIFPTAFAKLEATQTLPTVGQIISVKGKCESTETLTKIIGNEFSIYRGKE